MATNPSTQAENVGRITAPDSNYSYGSAQDDSTGTTGDGTPIQKALMNDNYGLQQALLRASGIVPSGSPDTEIASQYMQAIVEQASGRAGTLIESAGSVADSYVLEVASGNHAPAAPFNGMKIRFKPAASSTGGQVTVDAFGFGIGQVVNPDLSNPALNQIDLNYINEIEWDAINGAYILLDRDPVETKLRGLNFDGTTHSIALGADNIFVNSKSYYAAILPGVTTTNIDGILTVEMSSDKLNGGKQTYAIVDAGSSQLGELWERYITAGGAWNVAWRNVTNIPKDSLNGYTRGRVVSLRESVSLVESNSLVLNNTSIVDGTWTTVGPTGSGATYIWPELDVVPVNAEHVMISAYVSGVEALNGAEKLRIASIDAHEVGGGGINFPFYRISEVRLHSAENLASLYTDNDYVSSANIPLSSNNSFSLRWSNSFTGAQSINQISVVGWLE